MALFLTSRAGRLSGGFLKRHAGICGRMAMFRKRIRSLRDSSSASAHQRHGGGLFASGGSATRMLDTGGP